MNTRIDKIISSYFELVMEKDDLSRDDVDKLFESVRIEFNLDEVFLFENCGGMRKFKITHSAYRGNKSMLGYEVDFSHAELAKQLAMFDEESVYTYSIGQNSKYPMDSAALFGMIMLRYHFSIEMHYPLDYNNPFVVVAAMMLLLFFLSFSFRSKVINGIASSVFAAYLIQESCYFGHEWLYPQMREMFVHVSDGWRILALLGISIVFMLLCVLVDKILGILSQWILTIYDRLSITLKK